MVLSITAFCIRIYLRSLTFQEFLLFSFYLRVVGVFGMYLCKILTELMCFLLLYVQGILLVLENSEIHLDCFHVFL